MSTLICHTDGCENQDEPVEMDLSVVDPWTGQTVYVDSAVCGMCWAPITDVDPPFEPGTPV